jgi:hypothetical protein
MNIKRLFLYFMVVNRELKIDLLTSVSKIFAAIKQVKTIDWVCASSKPCFSKVPEVIISPCIILVVSSRQLKKLVIKSLGF